MEDKDVYIYNPTTKSVNVKAFGNYFEFKPDQMKRMRQSLGEFLAREKSYMGLVEIPERLYEDKEFRESAEGQALLAAKKEEGINNRVNHLQKVIHNLQVSLPNDLAKADIKVEAYAYASDGELDAMEELHTYQRRAEDSNKARIERARSLERKLKANSGTPAAKKDD